MDPETADPLSELLGENETVENEGIVPDLMNQFVDDLVEGDKEPEPEKAAEEEEPEKEEEPEAEKSTEEEPEKDDDEPELPDKASPAAKDSFNKLRGSRDKYKTEAEQVKTALEAATAELTALREKSALIPEIEEKLKNYDEMEKKLAVLRVEESPEFIKAIKAPLDAIEVSAESLAKSNDADVDEFFRALSEPDLAKQRELLKAATAGWDDMDRLDAKKMAEDTRDLLTRQREMRANAHETAKEQSQRASEAAEAAAKAARKEFSDATKDVLSSLKEKIPFVPLRDKETVEDRFAAISAKIGDMDFDKDSPRNKAFAAASAVMMPTMVKTVQSLQKEVAALEDRLKKKNGTSPAMRESSSPAQKEDDDFFSSMGMPKELTISERLNVTG